MPAAIDVAPKRRSTTSRAELAVAAVFAGWFGAAAVAHLAAAERFEAIIPPWLPAPGLLNAATAVALAVTAGLLVVSSTRHLGAAAAVGLLVVLQVAHVEQLAADVAVERVDGAWERTTGAGERLVLALRVVAQVPAMVGALWLARRAAGRRR